MPNLNRCFLMGNITRDPELKFTPKGTAVCQFGLAVNSNYKTSDGEKREETTFFDIEAWGKVAEVIAEHCKKGKPIYVECRAKTETWEDKQTGQKRSKMKFVLENFQFLGGKQEGQSDTGDTSERPGYRATNPPAGRAAGPPPTRPRPPADPALDAAPDEIPF